MSILHLINQDGYFIVNRELAKSIGLNPAIFLGQLISQFEYYQKKDSLISFDEIWGYFYAKIEDIQERTCLTRYEQDACVKKLTELGFISHIIKGMPGKRYFLIHEDKILAHFSNSQSSFGKNPKQGCGKTTNKDVEKPQTAPYSIYTRKEKGIKDLSLPREKEKNFLLIDHGKYVKLKDEDYNTFCKKYTKPVIDDLIERMNDHIAAIGKPYKCYAAALRNWLRNPRTIQNIPKTQTKEDLLLSARKIRLKYQLPTGVRWDESPDRIRVEMTQGAIPWCEEVLFSEKAFLEKVEHIFLKKGFKKNG